MSSRLRVAILVSMTVLWLGGTAGGQAQQGDMTFFITSTGSGNGADLGGLAGADKSCQMLAQAAGAGGKTWRAYLSTQGARHPDRLPAGRHRVRSRRGSHLRQRLVLLFRHEVAGLTTAGAALHLS